MVFSYTYQAPIGWLNSFVLLTTMSTLLPTVTANLSLTLSASVSADIITHWLSQRAGTPGTLANAISDTDTTFALNIPRGSSGSIGLAPGNTIVIDDEAMWVTAFDGSQVTVTRNIVPLAPPVQPHDAGANVSVLKYPDAWAVIAKEALLPWAQQVVAGLGSSSATFGATITGSLTT